jgi:single-stranded-DNA-specific exonuclease
LLAGDPAGEGYALGLADLASIGSVADVVPISGENRAILRLGVRALSTGARPGLAALLAAAGVDPRRVDVEQIGYSIAPRINAIGRIGHADSAARLLLTEDAAEAEALAAELEAANSTRRDLMTAALEEARSSLDAETMPLTGVVVVAGPWPVGIVGLVAGRLADEHGIPAIVFSTTVEPWRGSARGVPGFDLAAAFTECGDLFERFGGHAAAAGCHLPSERYPEFRVRIAQLAGAAAIPVASPESRRPTRSRSPRPLVLDLVVRAESADYVLLRELAPLDEGADDPPLVGLAGFVVTRVRRVRGDHTQLTLRRERDVVDAICFGRSDLADSLQEGMPIDVVARLSSRTFGGYESLQLDVRDVAPAGLLRALAQASADGSISSRGRTADIQPNSTAANVAIPLVGEPTPLVVSG